jgi:hypothetical protein
MVADVNTTTPVPASSDGGSSYNAVVPPSVSYRVFTFESLLVTGCTDRLNILTTVRSAHTVFMCFVFV